jgi:hypothetical protein
MSLKYTLDQVRKRETALIGSKGPTTRAGTAWWGLNDPTTNDCLGFQLYSLGVRGRADYAPHYVSISAFRAWAGWDEPALGEATAGDLVCENWSGGHEPEHIEYIYSIDRAAGEITTISANTGPKPGLPVPRGVWKKTRPLGDAFLFGIRPPYRDDSPSKGRMAEVRIVAAYLNRDNVLPEGVKTAAAADGIEGPIYWTLVQTWGRIHKLYGPTYRIDGVPGPRTRFVEAAIYAAARKAAKA